MQTLYIRDEYLFEFGRTDGSSEIDFNKWWTTLISLAFSFTPCAEGDYSPRLFWRGQSSCWQLTPGVHRSLRDTAQWGRGQRRFTDSSIGDEVKTLVNRARGLGVGPDYLTSTTDLQLLAFLQHQGAATPLIDFTSDLLTALAMACFDSTSHQNDGLLFCYKYTPCNANWVPPFTDVDAGAMFERLTGTSSSQVMLYSPPYLTARQRIQRGVFFFSAIDHDNPCSSMRIPFIRADEAHDRHLSRGHDGEELSGMPIRSGECLAVKVPSSFKPRLREWLRIQHQLEEDYVYPEPVSLDAHREFIRAASAHSLIHGHRLPSWG
ncbi:FRG domain-containing protein [Dietzia cinnamea]|uniref:FRG domain-containing protein n=1 Tax=Dietzia cinnamea TaxID=321318 RepID=UPI0021A40A43|nr:FRG domain-containing protein [Dietzia cinnamea]MCT1641329.1 FRG domain-containing protein [Dietzia cinnamea]